MDTALGRTESVLQATRRRYKNNALNRQLWRCPASSNIYPFGKTTTLLAFNINNVRVAPASAAYTVFLDRVRICPVFVFFNTLLLIHRGLLQKRLSRQLSCRRVGRAVLDRSVTVSEISEIMNITGGEKSASGQRMNRRITPLQPVSKEDKRTSMINNLCGIRTLSVQKPPLLSIISKNSSYSLLRNQSKRAISKLLQKWHML